MPEDESSLGEPLHLNIYLYQIFIVFFLFLWTLDILIESLMGVEMYKLAKDTKNNELHRRIQVGKWLYLQGFLSSDFPYHERFIPGHLL